MGQLTYKHLGGMILTVLLLNTSLYLPLLKNTDHYRCWVKCATEQGITLSEEQKQGPRGRKFLSKLTQVFLRRDQLLLCPAVGEM